MAVEGRAVPEDESPVTSTQDRAVESRAAPEDQSPVTLTLDVTDALDVLGPIS